MQWPGPCPAPGTGLVRYKLLQMSSTGMGIVTNIKLNENSAHEQKESLKLQKIVMLIYLKVVCHRAACSVGRSHPETAHNLRSVLSMPLDLQDHQ